MKQLIERNKYMQTLRDLKDQNIIKVITGVLRCGTSILPLQFVEYYEYMLLKSPNLSKMENLAVYVMVAVCQSIFCKNQLPKNKRMIL